MLGLSTENRTSVMLKYRKRTVGHVRLPSSETGQGQIVSELFPVHELHDLAPLELSPVSEL